VSASECWAVGKYYDPTTKADQTLIELWDGNSWAVVSSANTSATLGNVLDAVTCTSASQCWAVGYYLNGRTYQALTEFISPVELVSVVSTKAHGTAGTFNVDLTAGNGIECRSGGSNGDYTLVFTFADPLTNVDDASVSQGTGNIGTSGIGPNPNQYTVNLTGVTNAQTISVSLTNVTDSIGDFSSVVSGSMGVLLGDVNATGRVDAADVSAVRQQTLQSVTNSNFREDINTSGRIDAADVSIARQQTLTSLP
jgi:hypothetical protein